MAREQPQTRPPDCPPTRLRALLDRARRAGRRAMERPLLGLSVAAGALLGIVGLLLLGLVLSLGQTAPEDQLARALAELDAGRLASARGMAEQLWAADSLAWQDSGGPLYVLGATMAEQARQEVEPRQQQRLYLIASRYLGEARQRGFPPGRAADGTYLLASSLYHSGRTAESLPLLEEALPLAPQRRPELLWLLGEACRQEAPDELDRALESNGRFRAEPGLTPQQQQAGLLQQGQILFQLGDLAGSRQAIEAMDEKARKRPEVLVLQGRLLMQQATALHSGLEAAEEQGLPGPVQEKYVAARELLQRVRGSDPASRQAVREAQYLIGVTYRRQHELRAAERQFARLRQLYPHTSEGLAAGLAEAEIQQQQGRTQQALAAYGRVVDHAGEGLISGSPWFSRDELLARLRQAYASWLEADQYGPAIELAAMSEPLLPSGESLQKRAEAYRAWAEWLSAQAGALPAAEAGPVGAQARIQWRRAGTAYGHLARLRATTRQYPDHLWRSAQSWHRGRDYPRAVQQLQRYLENRARRYRPRALVALGEAHLALGQAGPALQSLEECIEFFPKHPESYRARLLASQAQLDRGELAVARKLLDDNLHHDALTPRSLEWRDSLFALGKLLYTQGLRQQLQGRTDFEERPEASPPMGAAAPEALEAGHAAYQQAVRTLHEAVRRYPQGPQTLEAWYLIAESQRRSASWPLRQRTLTADGPTRDRLDEQVRQHWHSALQAYQELQALLDQQRDNSPLSGLEQALLRNCHFARADLLFDLEHDEEALAAYAAAIRHAPRRPEVLQAYVQMARCYQRLRQPDEVQATLEQARQALARIPADADFTRTTAYNRNQWTSWLEQRETL